MARRTIGVSRGRAAQRALMTTLSLVAFGCGGSPPAAETARPAPPPERTAAQDTAIRSLLLELADYHLCAALQGEFVALPDADAAAGAAGGASPSAGRLWIERCTTARRGNRIALGLRGRGWTWVERGTTGPLGSSFTVRGHLRFQTSIDLAGEIDLGYAVDRKLVSIWLSPREAADATVTPLGAVPVAPDGGWSSVVGALGGVFGDTVEQRARVSVQQEGSAQMRDRLTSGLTVTASLCTGQTDVIVGALGNGVTPERPFAADGKRWLSNQRVRLRPNGLDVAGPWEATGSRVRIDLEVERGATIDARVMCSAEASAVAEAWLAGRAPERAARVRRAQRLAAHDSVAFELETRDCPLVLVTQPAPGATEPVVFRYRAAATDDVVTPLVRCERPQPAQVTETRR